MYAQVVMKARKLFARRRRERGAATAEGVIITGMMVIIMACLWGIVSAHRAKITAMDDARKSAWVAALKPCSGGGSTMGDITAATGQAESDAVPDTSESNQYLDPSKTSLGTDSGYITLKKTRQVTFPGVIGGSTYTMYGHMHMRCNEPNPPENLVDFFKTAFGVVKGVFSF